MDHDCDNCESEGVCSRHPATKKVGRLLAICRGEAEGVNEEVRQQYFKLWDYSNGVPGSLAINRPRPRPQPVFNDNPAGCTHRGACVGTCGGG